MNERLISIIIVGARGRMGTALIRAVMESEDLTLVGAVDKSGGPAFGQDAGRLVGMPAIGIDVTDELRPNRGSVVVDFSLPEATTHNVQRCVAAGVPLVLGTTGLDGDTQRHIEQAARDIPIVSAANFSVGVTVLTRLAAVTARALGADWDMELFELHHRHKRDAPSGTALRIGKAVAQVTGRDFDDSAVLGRARTDGPRKHGDIGLAALRGGDSIGEHTLMFLGTGERLELTHRAGDRNIFANGALRAARWVYGRQPGLYDMPDVLGLGADT